ncbi:MAG: helix-turn-helix domain-containing protein, partial [Candidatus Desulfofervidaceae bacterium]|nr:helix-turn-helix domain-containing protein [Candidatus Desulfofervidaceae bacterium]
MATLGEVLRKVRTGKDIPLEKVAAETKISFHYLKAIEEERWDALPAKPYVKGFLRIYANYLGLNPDRVIAQYEQGTSEQVFISPSSLKKCRKYITTFLFISILILGITFILWKIHTSEKRLTQSQTPPPQPHQAITPQQNSNKKTPEIQTASTKETPAVTQSSSPKTIRINRIYICSGVKNREPVGLQTAFHLTKPTFIYCFTEVIGAKKPIEIKHLWYYGER